MKPVSYINIRQIITSVLNRLNNVVGLQPGTLQVLSDRNAIAAAISYLSTEYVISPWISQESGQREHSISRQRPMTWLAIAVRCVDSVSAITRQISPEQDTPYSARKALLVLLCHQLKIVIEFPISIGDRYSSRSAFI
ncbi:MAG: hypothetical protein M3Z04_20755, partial [Chloroflexota bacterium]|nr:hypothetical protein [Chloroflexota bacterium]